MSKRSLLILSGVAVVAIAAVAVGLMKKNSNQALEVHTAPVKRRQVIETVTATGKVQPHIQVKISADVSAKITKLTVKEGDWVEKGQLLVELDRERYVAAVERAEASLRSSQSEAELAKESMLKAEKDYLRSKELFAKKVESSAAYDAAVATYQVEKARYAAALNNVEQSKALLKQAQDDLSKTRIYAPMTGTISQLNKEVGEIALGSQFQEDVILVLADLVGMEALVDVDENDVVTLALSDTAHIEVDAVPGTIFRGFVSEIANTAKVTDTGTADQKTEFEVKVTITGTVGSAATNSVAQALDGRQETRRSTADLRPGMSASCDIVTATHDSVIAVPIQSVTVRTLEQLQQKLKGRKEGETNAEEAVPAYVPDKDGFVEVVFVVQNGVVQARQVKTGIQSDTHIEIVHGLSENDEVVVGSFRAISKDLQNGMAIKTATAPKKENET